MKKRIAKISGLLLLAAFLITSVSAANASDEISSSVLGTASGIDQLSTAEFDSLAQSVRSDMKIAEEYAYLDIKAASPAAKEIILAARENVIYHTSWYNSDICTGAVLVGPDGKVVLELSAFQEIFPADWSVPKQDTFQIPYRDLQSLFTSNDSPGGARLHTEFFRDVWVENPPTGQNTTPYGWIVCAEDGEGTIGQTIERAEGKVNLGITRLSDNLDVINALNVEEGYVLMGIGVAGETYGLRASTYETPRSVDLIGLWWEYL